MICDGEKEIGIAGIMGEKPMVTDDIKTLLFEARCLMGQISDFLLRESV